MTVPTGESDTVTVSHEIRGSVVALHDAIRSDVEIAHGGGVPVLSERQIEAILADERLREVMGVQACGHPNLPVAWVIDAVSEGGAVPGADLLLGAAGNPWLDEDGMRALAAWSGRNGLVLDEVLAANAAVPVDVLLEIGDRFDVDAVSDPDDGGDVTAAVLRALELSPNPHVVDLLMRHPSVTVAVIERVRERADAAGKQYASVEDALEDARAWLILHPDN